MFKKKSGTCISQQPPEIEGWGADLGNLSCTKFVETIARKIYMPNMRVFLERLYNICDASLADETPCCQTTPESGGGKGNVIISSFHAS